MSEHFFESIAVRPVPGPGNPEVSRPYKICISGSPECTVHLDGGKIACICPECDPELCGLKVPAEVLGREGKARAA